MSQQLDMYGAWDPMAKTDAERWWETAELQREFVDAIRGTLDLDPMPRQGSATADREGGR